MAETPNVLVIEPASAREGLESLLSERGIRCIIARGLHNSLVQAAIRTPSLVVVDLSVPDTVAREAWQRLRQFAHFGPHRFLLIGGEGGLSTNATPEQVRDAIVERLSSAPAETADSAGGKPEEAPAPAAAEPGPGLASLLEDLRTEAATASVTVLGPDGSVGEILLRDGDPIHAVTADGLSGPEALAQMRAWPGTRVEMGSPPRDEVPVTIVPEPAEPARPAAGEDDAVVQLLAELEAVGVIRPVDP